jgi:hypothetical protein
MKKIIPGGRERKRFNIDRLRKKRREGQRGGNQ